MIMKLTKKINTTKPKWVLRKSCHSVLFGDWLLSAIYTETILHSALGMAGHIPHICGKFYTAGSVAALAHWPRSGIYRWNRSGNTNVLYLFFAFYELCEFFFFGQ